MQEYKLYPLIFQIQYMSRIVRRNFRTLRTAASKSLQTQFDPLQQGFCKND